MLIEYIKQLFCKHNYILGHQAKQYYDFSGYRVTVWRVYCTKCGKWTNKKFR